MPSVADGYGCSRTNPERRKTSGCVGRTGSEDSPGRVDEEVGCVGDRHPGEGSEVPRESDADPRRVGEVEDDVEVDDDDA